MTPKEKALKLYQDFHYRICNDNGLFENESNILCAKNCALIAVEEMLNTCDTLIDGKRFVFQKLYLDELKKEIEKL